ncbi:hypothetical protein Ancab_029344 [Ancistrocladus abbreviatus]
MEKILARCWGFNDQMLGRTCPRLLHLDLEDCKSVTTRGVKEFVGKCRGLRYLNLGGCDESGLDLEELNVSGNKDPHAGSFQQLDGISFVLQKSRNLSSLTLAGKQINLLGMKGHIDCSRVLSSLIFIHMEISDQFLDSMIQANLPLKRFILSNCSGYTFAGISLLLQRYQTLESVAFDGAEFLTNESIEYMVQFMGKCLYLSQCFRREELDLVIVPESCREIRHLDITGCKHVNFNRMEDDLEDCQNVTTEGVRMVEKCQRLRCLNLSGCNGVDFEIVDWIVSLRHLVSPSLSFPDEKQQQDFASCGCLVDRTTDYG